VREKKEKKKEKGNFCDRKRSGDLCSRLRKNGRHLKKGGAVRGEETLKALRGRMGQRGL